MKTVLLWGDRWWLSDAPEPLPFADSEEAARVLAAHLGPKHARLRLIFQPDTLATVATPCPKGSRPTLVAALSAGFPALGTAGHAWSHEPILARSDSFATLLHFEREPRLEMLLAQLAAQGIAVDSVWPLPTFLHALPDEWSESGAMTIVAVSPDRVCGYRHPADGERNAPAWSGENALAEFGAWLGDILAKSPDEPVLLVGDSEAAAALQPHVELHDHPNVTWLSLTEALARRVVWPRHHPAQFLAPMPVITAQRAVIAASLAFLALTGWSGAAYAHDILAWRTAGADREIRKQALRAEVAHLQGNAAEITRLRETLGRAAVHPPAGTLLQKIAATTPRQVACDALSVTTTGFALHGHLAPSAPAGTGEAWRARLTDPAWTLDLKPSRDGAFNLAGTFSR
jgi:hypothetical protein